MNNVIKNKKPSYFEKMTQETLVALMRDYVAKATHEEVMEMWKMLAKEDPATALSVLVAPKASSPAKAKVSKKQSVEDFPIPKEYESHIFDVRFNDSHEVPF